MPKERFTVYRHRTMAMRHMLEGAFRRMSHLEVEGLENIADFKDPAIVYSPHPFYTDFLGVSIAIGKPIIPTYEKQKFTSPGIVGTLTAMYVGGIEIKENMTIAEAKKFLAQVYEAFDENQWVFIHPEGSNNHYKREVSGNVADLVKITRSYQNHCKREKRERPEVALIPVGEEYKPWPRGKLPPPWATELTVRIGKPIFPSEHSNWTMDDYMRIIARLSGRDYAPDVETLNKFLNTCLDQVHKPTSQQY